MLESEIKKLTAAVEANTAALIGGAVAAPSAPKPAAAAAATVELIPGGAPAPSTAIDIPVDVEVPPAALAAAAPVVEVTLKQITEKVLELAKAKSRDVAFSLLAEYGATKVPELKGKEAQFAEIAAKIDALLAAV